MNHKTVEFDGLQPIFPKCIPKKRENRDIIDKAILVGSVCAPNSTLTFILASSVSNYFILLTAELCSRISCLREEFAHLESRYEKSVLKLVQKTFSFNKRTTFATIIIVFGAILTNENIFKQTYRGNIISWFFSFIGVKLLSDLLEMNENQVNTAKLLDKFSPLCYHAAMAFSLFYGYLNFMLPSTGGATKSLKQQIIDYADRNGGIQFASHKLFIFIPLSTKCPPNIEDYSPLNILERCDNLEKVEKDVAGIKDRNYHHTVYKLWYNGIRQKPVYVCAVCVLRSLYQVMEHDHEETRIYKKYRNEIVLNFSITLHKIIAEKGYSNLCELILFKDTDEHGQFLYEDKLDIGDLLARKINPRYIPR